MEENILKRKNFLVILSQLSAIAVGLVAFTWLLREMQTILIPISIGLVVGLMFSPLVQLCKKYKIPAFLGIICIVLFFLVASALFSRLLYTSLLSLTEVVPKYQNSINSLLTSIPILRIDNQLQNFQEQLFNYIRDSLLGPLSRGFLRFSSQYLIVVFVLFMFLFEIYMLPEKLFLMTGKNKARFRELSEIIVTINKEVSFFLLIKTLLSLFTGVLVYITFSIIGVDLALFWGIATVLLNYIPSIGSIIITVMTSVFALIQFYPNLNLFFATLISMTLFQMIIGNVLDPHLTGDRLNLSPFIILLSLLYWGWVWGSAGMLLAVPFAVTARVIFVNTERLQWLGHLFLHTKGVKSALMHRKKKEKKDAT